MGLFKKKKKEPEFPSFEGMISGIWDGIAGLIITIVCMGATILGLIGGIVWLLIRK